MAPVVRNINISAAGHKKYFMHPFLYIWYIPEGSKLVGKSVDNTFCQVSFSCACVFLLAH